jgi:hypothetical protein
VAHAQNSRIIHNDNLAASIEEESYDKVVGSGQNSGQPTMYNARGEPGESTVEDESMIVTQNITNS